MEKASKLPASKAADPPILTYVISYDEEKKEANGSYVCCVLQSIWYAVRVPCLHFERHVNHEPPKQLF